MSFVISLFGARFKRTGIMSQICFVVLVLTTHFHFIQSAYGEGSDEVRGEVANEKNSNGFFPAESPWYESGSASTVFAKEPVKSEAPQVGFYQEKKEKEPEQDLDESLDQSGMPVAQRDPKTARPPFDTRKANPKQLVSFYGDPDAEAPLTPEDNAPKPFKALMAAMDSGNDELAYKYARQYVRYISNLSNRVKTVGQFTELAFEREGIRKGNLKDNPYTHLLQEDFDREGEDPTGDIIAANPKAARLLDQARKDEEKEAQKKKEIPVDVKGEVDILFFFNIGDGAAQDLARSVQEVAEKFSTDSKVHVTGFSIQPVSPGADAAFRKATGAQFPIHNGQAAATHFGITASPTVLFIARNSMKSYRIEEVVTTEKLLNVVMKMKGGRRAVEE